MPSRANTDLIRDLIQEVATLKERGHLLRQDIDRVERALTSRVEEADRKIWRLTMALCTALLALAVTFEAGLFR